MVVRKESGEGSFPSEPNLYFSGYRPLGRRHLATEQSTSTSMNNAGAVKATDALSMAPSAIHPGSCPIPPHCPPLLRTKANPEPLFATAPDVESKISRGARHFIYSDASTRLCCDNAKGPSSKPRGKGKQSPILPDAQAWTRSLTTPTMKATSSAQVSRYYPECLPLNVTHRGRALR